MQNKLTALQTAGWPGKLRKGYFEAHTMMF